MPYQLEVRPDGLVRIVFMGEQDAQDLEAFRREFEPLLVAATEDNPVLALVDGTRSSRFTAGARKVFLELNKSFRIGKAAIWGADRYTRVLASFVLKATGRGNIHFTETEEEAVAWLKGETSFRSGR